MLKPIQHKLFLLAGTGLPVRAGVAVDWRAKSVGAHRLQTAGQLAAVVLSASLAMSAQAQVYVGANAPGGSIVLSNFPSQQAPDLLLPAIQEPVREGAETPQDGSGAWARLPIGAEPLRGVIERVAKRVDIAPRLIHAVILAESNYNAKAVSPKGAVGLMQLMPATAKRFGVRDPLVVKDNLMGGASYLKWLMGYFKGDIELVLAAYNAGEGAVVRAGHKVPNYPETQAYVRRIMANLRATESAPL